MKNKLIIRQGIKVIIITLIVGTSCLSPNQPYNVPEQEMNVQDLTSTQIHKATNLPTTNLEATSHLILTNEYIGTPLPTIHPNDVGNFVRALYLKCSLPCWGSITPGKTSEMETKYLLSPFGKINTSSVSFQVNQKPVVIDLTFKDNIVTSINLPPEITDSYRIDKLLTENGIPEDILIEIIPETAEGKSWFYLVTLYPKKGFWAIFSGEGKSINSIINICLQNVLPDLYLVEANIYSLEEMTAFLDLILQQIILKPLDTITEKNKSQFYDTFKKDEGSCLATNFKTP